MQKISGRVRRAVDDYNMIEDGDKIAVALSGGKDSIALLYKMRELQYFYRNKFELVAITINPGFPEFDEDLLHNLCENVGVPLVIYKSNIKEIVFDERKETNPCSLCANLRRGMLNTVAKENGCNKIALGHNEDDVIETLLMNMIFAGNFSTIAPITYMDKSGMTLIRPLIYVSEKGTKSFCKSNGITPMPKVCPQDGNTSRQFAFDLLRSWEIKNKHTRANLMGAIKRAGLNGWKEADASNNK